MNENQQIKQADELAKLAYEILDMKKADEVKMLSVRKKTVLADFLVIATGTSNTHVSALSGELEFQLREKLGISPLRTEGFSGDTWVLLDYGSVIVHIFTQEAREFYKLEKLWEENEANVTLE